MNFIWALLFWFLRAVSTQDISCDFHDTLTATTTKALVSPNYPGYYGRDLQCRWIIDSPAGYNCHLNCSKINLPQSTDCSSDRLLVSEEGSTELKLPKVLCGRRAQSFVSTGQRIVVGLITSAKTHGGNFYCQVSTQPVNPTCNCGMRRQNRIVGGKETGINEYPMMVGIFDKTISSIICGGTIISNYYVLTAAHCLTILRLESTLVIAGAHNVSKIYSPPTKLYKVYKFIIHPQYNDTTDDYDIALIKVREPIEFNDRVGPVCLPFKFNENDFYGKKVTVLGWGTIFFGGSVSSVLLEATLDVIKQSQCRRAVPSVTYRQICTFTLGKDSCQHDSGGPLLYTDPQTARLFLVGIVSHGQTCASKSYPAVNTRVIAFLRWINTNTNVNYCMK